jgi:hypothetical protein
LLTGRKDADCLHRNTILTAIFPNDPQFTLAALMAKVEVILNHLIDHLALWARRRGDTVFWSGTGW